MKLLIGYDGSTFAEYAIDDLRRAGLPDDVEAVVLTVADVWPLALVEPGTSPESPPRSARSDAVYNLARQTTEQARQRAHAGAVRVSSLFPKWRVRPDISVDMHECGLANYARKFNPDLLVVGERGRSKMKQMVEQVLRVTGSVAQTTVRQAHCSVRVGRKPHDLATPAERPIRFVIGIDGSEDSRRTVDVVRGRRWAAGTEAIVIGVVDKWMMTAIPFLLPGPDGGANVDPANPLRRMLEVCSKQLCDSGIAATPKLVEGDPKRVLAEEAQRWQADCIFVGARGLGRIAQMLLGSVSSAVAERATCSVEVVR